MGKIKIEDSGGGIFKMSGKAFLKGQYVIEYLDFGTDNNGNLITPEKITILLRPSANNQPQKEGIFPFKSPVLWSNFVDNVGTPYANFQDFSEALATAVSSSGSSASIVWGSITGTLSDQTDLQSALDNKVIKNPSITGATKTKITYDSKGLVTSGADASLSELTEDITHRVVTDAQIASWNAVIGGSVFQTTWNATTNSPSLVSSTGTKGFYYIVATAGSTNLDGITDWKVGDWAIFDGTVWRKVDNTDAVSSVNSLTGAVSLDTSNVPDTLNKRYQTDNQNTRNDATSSIQTQLDSKAPIASPTFTGTVITPAIIVSSETASTLVELDASKNIKSLPLASYPSKAELAYVKGVTSAIQTQIDNLSNLSSNIAETAINGASSSGTTNTYSTGVQVASAKISSGQMIEIVCKAIKTGVNGTLTIRIYANATNDLSGSPILIATSTTTANSQIYAPIDRTLAIKVKAGTGLGTEVLLASTSAADDVSNRTNTTSTLAIDWTTSPYIVVAVQCSNASDSALVSFVKIRR